MTVPVPDHRELRTGTLPSVRNFFDDRAGYPRFRKRRAEPSIRFQPDQRQIHRNFDANDRRLVLAGLGAVH